VELRPLSARAPQGYIYGRYCGRALRGRVKRRGK
jgi:hypothetical protein